MKRRALLGGTGAVLAALAGCVTGLDPEQPPAENGTETASDDGRGETPTGTPDGDLVYGNSDEEPAFADIGCPSFAESVDATICSHTNAGAGVAVAVSQTVFAPTTDDGTVETMAVVFHNVSDTQFGFNPHDWQLKRRSGDGWEHVAPEEHVEPWETLAPDERYVWRLRVEPHPGGQPETGLTITEDLASGTYAFQTTGLLGASSGAGESKNIECVALFGVRRRGGPAGRVAAAATRCRL